MNMWWEFKLHVFLWPITKFFTKYKLFIVLNQKMICVSVMPFCGLEISEGLEILTFLKLNPLGPNLSDIRPKNILLYTLRQF